MSSIAFPERRWRTRGLSHATAVGGLYGGPIGYPWARVLAVRAFAVVAVVAGGRYIIWRLGTLGGTGWFGAVFYAAEAFTYLFTVLTAIVLWRVRWRAGVAGPARGTLDVFIPVCGEPAALVEQTLVAALAIEYPHKTYLLNDGRIAGKANWREIVELGERHGVPVLTRLTGTSGKAGNLNHGLAGTRGEFVAVIDADHAARTEFADETLGYFADDEVAFVCSPQQFLGDDADPLNNRELFFYRYVQATKDAANAAFSCGNASIYRRRALEGVGGFSEWGLVEDLHTSYCLHAGGWQSVYHPRPLTAGLTPETAAAFVKQRLVWANDGLRLFFWDNPLCKRGLSLMQRLNYLHTTGFYLVACLQLLFVAAPILYVFGGIAAMRGFSPGAYLAHTAPYLGALAVFLWAGGGSRGGLKAAQSGLVLAPTYLIALVSALLRVRRRARVTEKVRLSRMSTLILPQLAAFCLALLALMVGIAHPSSGNFVSAFWCGYVVLALSGFVSALSDDSSLTRQLRRGLRTAAGGLVILLFASLTIGSFPVLGSRGDVAFGAQTSAIARASQERRVALVPPVRGAYIGVFNPDLLSGPHAVTHWAAAHGVKPQIVHWYQQWWSGETRFRADWLAMVARQGAVPMITWEPWTKPRGSVHSVRQPWARLALIASGRYDAYIRSWAAAAAAYRKPILLRFMHEMNGRWYPWSIHTNGNSPTSYVRAWRHVHDLFVEAGATNVRWVWAVNTFTDLRNGDRDLLSYYPGSRYVDWVSATGFNWGGRLTRSFDALFAPTYARLARFHKPIMISEVGTARNAGDAAWVRAALASVPRRLPLIKAIVWFDSPYSHRIDFQLHGAEARAFQAQLHGDYWHVPVAESVSRSR